MCHHSIAHTDEVKIKMKKKKKLNHYQCITRKQISIYIGKQTFPWNIRSCCGIVSGWLSGCIQYVMSSPPGRVIPKTIIKMVQTASLHVTQCVSVGVWQCNPIDCLKGRVVCGTACGDMHLKDLLGSIVRVGYRISVQDFYLVLHGLRCRKNAI